MAFTTVDQIQAQIDLINATLYSGVDLATENGRTMRFDRNSLLRMRMELEAQKAALSPGTAAPQVKRHLTSTPTRGY